MKKAIIDLGTNTFNLLIGSIENGVLTTHFATKEAVMLGMGGINEGFIAEDAMQRAKQTLENFKNHCIEHQVSHILGIGTSAMRGATNATELIRWAVEYLEIDIRIVSGDEEAKLIYNGVSLLHPFQEPGLIMDIGGGSNEFIVASSGGVSTSASFNIGVSRLYQMMGEPEIMTDELLHKVDRFFQQETGDFFDGSQVSHLIGASGSFETLYEMLHEKEFPDDSEVKELPLEQVHRLLNWSISSTLEERMSNDWIVPMRKKMLPLAAYSILWVMQKMGTKKVTICPYSLKEGAFLL